MAKQSLNYLNHSLNSYDLITEYLDKAYALASVALSEHFATSKNIVENKTAGNRIILYSKNRKLQWINGIFIKK
jgi:hypothetical protein